MQLVMMLSTAQKIQVLQGFLTSSVVFNAQVRSSLIWTPRYLKWLFLSTLSSRLNGGFFNVSSPFSCPLSSPLSCLGRSGGKRFRKGGQSLYCALGLPWCLLLVGYVKKKLVFLEASYLDAQMNSTDYLTNWRSCLNNTKGKHRQSLKFTGNELHFVLRMQTQLLLWLKKNQISLKSILGIMHLHHTPQNASGIVTRLKTQTEGQRHTHTLHRSSTRVKMWSLHAGQKPICSSWICGSKRICGSWMCGSFPCVCGLTCCSLQRIHYLSRRIQ